MSVPTLKQLPMLQRLNWISNPVDYMEKAVKQQPDIFAADILGGNQRLIFVNQPQAIQKILTSDRREFLAEGEANAILKPVLGDSSIIMIDGNQHKQRRKLLMPSFHGERIQVYGQLIVDLTKQSLDKIPAQQPFIARQVTQEISLQVILQAIYGLYEGKKSQDIKQALSSLSEVFRSALSSSFLFFTWLQKDFGAWSPWGSFIRLREKIDKLLYEEIAKRRSTAGDDRQDILSLLMLAKDENGAGMNDVELRDELMTLMFAGHETTATALAWALYWIHRQPRVYEKLQAELATLEEKPNPLEIARLPYLTAVCQETLRIYPVGMLTFPRIVKEPIEILGYKLEPQDVLVGCIYLAHHREDIYPQSKEFKPERFLNKQYSPYEFLTFGGGSRRCLGEALAQLELKLVIATILSNYQLKLVSQTPELPRRRGVTLAPSTGVKMRKCK
ncbi:MAG: cytochrome P450 [Cyanobacteria bacterium J083]|nr:MAG: cytochrome P450 [Cyanobacteria bacterium J083]